MDNGIKDKTELEVNVINKTPEEEIDIDVKEFPTNNNEKDESEIEIKNSIKNPETGIVNNNDNQEIEIDSISSKPEIEIDATNNKKSPLTANVNGENKNNEIEKKNKNTHIWWGLPANLVTELFAPMLGVVGGCGALLAILWLLDKEFTIPGISKKAKDTRDKLNDEISMNLGSVKKGDPKKFGSIGKTLANSLSNDDLKSIGEKSKKLEDYLIKKLGNNIKNDIKECKFNNIINAINNNINSTEIKREIKNICATQNDVNTSLLKSFLGSKTVESGQVDNKAPSMQTKKTIQMKI